MRYGKRHICLGLAVVAGLSVAVVGCSTHHEGSAAVDRREKAVDTVGDLRTDLKRADDQVGITQESLHRLAAQRAGNLKPSYESLIDGIDKNKSMNEKIASRSMDLATIGSEHVNAWDIGARGIESDALRQESLNREQQARDAQQRTLNSVNDLRGMYTQYIRQLEDLATYAGNDLTPRGVAALGGQTQRADQLAQELRDRMAQVDVRLDQLAQGLRMDTPLAARATTSESGQPAGGTMPPADRTTPPSQTPANTPARSDNPGM